MVANDKVSYAAAALVEVDTVHAKLSRYIPETYLDTHELPNEFDFRIKGIRFSKTGDKLRIGPRFYSCETEEGIVFVTKCDTVDEKIRHRWALPSFIDQKVALLSSIRAKSDPNLNMLKGFITGESACIKVSSTPGSIRIGSSEYSISAGVVFEEFKISGENSVIYRPCSEYLPGIISLISCISRRKAEERAAIEGIKRKKCEANARKTKYIKEHRQAVARERIEKAESHRRRMEARDIRMAAELGITGGGIKDIRRRLEDNKSRERMREKVAYAQKLGVDTASIHVTEERLEREIQKKKTDRFESRAKAAGFSDSSKVSHSAVVAIEREMAEKARIRRAQRLVLRAEDRPKGGYASYKDRLKERHAIVALGGYDAGLCRHSDTERTSSMSYDSMVKNARKALSPRKP